MNNHHLSTRCRGLALAPKAWEAVEHSCDNGHKWVAGMYPVAGQDQWKYVNTAQRYCPYCNQARSDEEPI
jgi:hypothetical protein